jgi:hypothetical protein
MRSKIVKIVAALPAVLVAGIAVAPVAQADGTQASAEQAVGTVYNQVQRRCTPSLAPSLQSISWEQFNGNYGKGRIVDADPRLGGSFQIGWDNTNGSPAAGWRRSGQWDVELEFC